MHLKQQGVLYEKWLGKRLLVSDKLLNVLKWTATALLVPAGYMTQAGYAQGPTLLYIAGLIWLAAALMMRDKALIATNVVMAVAGTAGILQKLYVA
jgi:hypothetical protein